MDMYFYNTGNKQHYKILARYFDDVMLLETKRHHYIVALWVETTDEDFFMGEWGSGHYWMDDFESAKNDFLEIAYTTYKEDNAWMDLISKEEFNAIYEEA